MPLPRYPIRFLAIALFTTLALLLWGQARPARSGEAPEAPHPDLCLSLLQSLEGAAETQGLGTDVSVPLPGYPSLRTNRFLNQMHYFVSEKAERDQWLDLLRLEGERLLHKVVQNLPNPAIQDLLQEVPPLDGPGRTDVPGQRARLAALTEECGHLSLSGAGQDPTITAPGFRPPPIPSEYHKARRVVGLYPLVVPAMGTAIAHYKKAMKERYALPLDRLGPSGRLKILAPPPVTERRPVPALLKSSSHNPLGIPLPDPQTLHLLAQAFAPILEQDVTGDYDLPGAVQWQGPRVEVDTENPVVYYYGSHALVSGTSLLQLNYVFWYTQRPPLYPLDIEAGRIHGMTFRITLSPGGIPLMAEAIHNCGCYHFFFPSPTVFQAPKTALFREDAFVPQWLPPGKSDEGLALRIETRRHRVERLHYRRRPATDMALYRLVPYDILESLPRPSGSRQSIFTPEGLVQGDTERLERFLLFPVGIPSIGSMRQRGHHGTALVGRRIFDDPRLFETFFFLNHGHRF